MDPYYLEVRQLVRIIPIRHARANDIRAHPSQAVFDSLREAGETREGFGEASNVERHSKEEIEKFTIDEARIGCESCVFLP